MNRRPEFARIRVALAASVHFRELAAADLDRLAALGRIVALKDGTYAGRAGTRRREVWIVLSGSMRMSSVGAAGGEFVYAMLGPGSFYGIGSFLSDSKTLVDARAAGPTELIVMSGSQLMALLDERRWLWRHIAKLLHRRLTLAMTALSDLALAPLSQRIIRRLLSQAMSAGDDLRHARPIALRLSQADLARMLGVSRPKINTELQSLAHDGLIQVRYRKIVLTDFDRLCQRAGAHVFAF